MALSVFAQASRRLPVLNNLTCKLLAPQFKSTKLLLTPTIRRSFSGLSSPILKNLNASKSLMNQSSRSLSHSAIWTLEKALSIALLGIIPGCIYTGGSLADNFLAVSVVLHMHWGVESIIVDYLRYSLVGPVIPKIAHIAVYVISVITLAGLMYFNYNDIGLSRAVKRLWSVRANY